MKFKWICYFVNVENKYRRNILSINFITTYLIFI